LPELDLHCIRVFIAHAVGRRCLTLSRFDCDRAGCVCPADWFGWYLRCAVFTVTVRLRLRTVGVKGDNDGHRSLSNPRDTLGVDPPPLLLQ
jgi:hypothetical protein